MKKLLKILFLGGLLTLASLSSYAQFEKPEIEKISTDRTAWFMSQFGDINWTGAGFYDDVAMDTRQTNEIRARLQKVYGDPTKTIENLINTKSFRLAKAIQFEYWFVINDSIPMMVLDIDGPFGRGLVYAGASKYIDLMPQIKRTFSKEIMKFDRENLANYQDYYYSPERGGQWFQVKYNNGNLRTSKVSRPSGM